MIRYGRNARIHRIKGKNSSHETTGENGSRNRHPHNQQAAGNGFADITERQGQSGYCFIRVADNQLTIN